MEIERLRLNRPAQFQQREEQGNKFRRERELAVTRLPTGGEDEKASLPGVDLRECRRAIVELRQHMHVRVSKVYLSAFPKMNFREIAEACVCEWCEERVRKIN